MTDSLQEHTDFDMQDWRLECYMLLGSQEARSLSREGVGGLINTSIELKQ